MLRHCAGMVRLVVRETSSTSVVDEFDVADLEPDCLAPRGNSGTPLDGHFPLLFVSRLVSEIMDALDEKEELGVTTGRCGARSANCAQSRRSFPQRSSCEWMVTVV